MRMYRRARTQRQPDAHTVARDVQYVAHQRVQIHTPHRWQRKIDLEIGSLTTTATTCTHPKRHSGGKRRAHRRQTQPRICARTQRTHVKRKAETNRTARGLSECGFTSARPKTKKPAVRGARAHTHTHTHNRKNEGKQAPVVQTHAECPALVRYRSRQKNETHGHVPPLLGAFLQRTSTQRSLHSTASALPPAQVSTHTHTA